MLALRRFSLTNYSLFCTMVCQSATSGTLRNMSLEKAKAPGVLPKVVAMVVLIACIAVARAESSMSRACVIFCVGVTVQQGT